MNVLVAHNFIQVRNGKKDAFELTKDFFPEGIAEKLTLIAEKFPPIDCFFQETETLSGTEYKAFLDKSPIDLSSGRENRIKKGVPLGTCAMKK